MLQRKGQRLTGIMLGNIDPLQTMLDGDLLYNYYSYNSSARCYPHVFCFVERLIFHNPHMSMLEIGAGTAGMTLELFKFMSANKPIQIQHYDLTDMSAGFFQRARKLLAEWTEFINFRTLSIKTDQGYIQHSYDLVVAANVLHATRSIDESLQNARKLLKTGGTLLLIEATRPQNFLNLTFGTLPG